MKLVAAISVFICGEFLSYFIFGFIKRSLVPEEKKLQKISVIKGILERLTLFIGLLYGFPQIIIAFSAMKLGTRLSQETKEKISNDYFLVGNLVSILLAMVYTIVVSNLLPR